MSKNCNWFSNERTVVLVSAYNKNQSEILISVVLYKNGEIEKCYKEIYHNNPCAFYRRYVTHNKVIVDIPFNKIDAEALLKLKKDGIIDY